MKNLKDRHQKIIDRYNSGSKIADICGDFGTTPATVYNILAQHSIPHRGKGVDFHKLKPFIKSYLVNPVQDLTALSKKYHVGRTTMYALLNKYENPTNPNITDPQWKTFVEENGMDRISREMPHYTEAPLLIDLRTTTRDRLQDWVVTLYTTPRTPEQYNSQILSGGEVNPNYNPALPTLRQHVSVTEIAQITGLSVKEVRNILKRQRSGRDGLPLYRKYSTGAAMTPIDSLREKIRVLTNQLREMEKAEALDPAKSVTENVTQPESSTVPECPVSSSPVDISTWF